PSQRAVADLAPILDAEEVGPRSACVLSRAGAIRAQQDFDSLDPFEHARVLDIAQIRELGNRAQAVRVAGMSGDENQLVLSRSGRIPFEVLDLCWLPIFVGAKETDIQVESGIFEVVRIAPI